MSKTTELKSCRTCKYNDEEFCLRFPPQFCNFHSEAQFPMIRDAEGVWYRACGEYRNRRQKS